jgi:ribosomal protein S18 acetylase RimI-like enzyme
VGAHARADDTFLGMIIVACHSTSRIGFIGEYVIREDLRGSGIGRALWEKGIEYLRERGCTNIGLSGAQSRPDASLCAH